MEKSHLDTHHVANGKEPMPEHKMHHEHIMAEFGGDGFDHHSNVFKQHGAGHKWHQEIAKGMCSGGKVK